MTEPPLLAEEKLTRFALQGVVRIAILNMLRQKEMSGYSILKKLKELTGIHYHSGVIYPILYELEEIGLITSSWRSKGGRRLRIYKLTVHGTEILEKLKVKLHKTLSSLLEDLLRSELEGKG